MFGASSDREQHLDAGPIADQVVQLAALEAELEIRLEYEPAEELVELMLRVADAALSVVDEAGCFAHYVLQMADTQLLPACRTRRKGRAR